MEEPQPLSSDERTWALVSHLGSIAGFVLSAGTIAWLAPLIIWLAKRKDSRFVAFHALQELFFQLAWMVLLWVAVGVAVVLTFACIGVLLWPVIGVAAFAPVVWPVIAAIKANNGEWYEYPVVGRWALNNVGGGSA